MNINLNIILPSTIAFLKQCLSLSLPHQIPAYTSLIRATWPVHFIRIYLSTRIIHTHINTYCSHTHTQIYTYIYTYIDAYIYIYVYIHTYTNVPSFISQLMGKFVPSLVWDVENNYQNTLLNIPADQSLSYTTAEAWNLAKGKLVIYTLHQLPLQSCTSTLVGEYDVSEPLIRKPAIGHDPECVHFPPPADFTRYFPQISPYVQGTYYQCVTLCFPVPCNVRTQAEETVDQWEYKKCVTSRGWRDIWASIISYSLSISDCNTLVHEVNICFTAFLKKRPMEKAVNSV